MDAEVIEMWKKTDEWAYCAHEEAHHASANRTKMETHMFCTILSIQSPKYSLDVQWHLLSSGERLDQ